jgi:hypothetical protein
MSHVQMDIFTGGPAPLAVRMTPPLARRTDPETSHAAAAEAKELQADHHALIVAVLKRSGPLGVDGIAARCGLTGHAAGKRMKELERQGLIELTGRKVASTSGRMEREWQAL